MEKIINKEEAVAMLIERYALNADERLFIETVCAVIYEHGTKDGLIMGGKIICKANEAILEGVK